MWSQAAFKDKLGVSIEQLSDFEPKGAACSAFGVYHPGGFAQRALIVTGPDAVVRWSYEAPSPGELPGVDLLQEGPRRGGCSLSCVRSEKEEKDSGPPTDRRNRKAVNYE